MARQIDEIIIATCNKAIDRPIKKSAQNTKVKIFAGSEDDVLDRYYQAAITFKVDIILRITADCPLIDPKIIDSMLRYYLKNKFQFDYISLPKSYPEGLDAEVFSFPALERVWQRARKPSEREHVTPYMWNHPETFRIGNLPVDIKGDFSHFHWSVDQWCDLKFVRKVYKKLYRKGSIFYTEDILKLLENEPRITEINKGFTGYEGYLKSLKADKVFLKNSSEKN